MTFLSIFAFGKEFIIFNDSFVIFTVMGLLLLILKKNLSSFFIEFFHSIRQTTEYNLSIIVKDMLKNSLAYRNKLEDIIELNYHRALLVPTFEDNTEEVDPITNIKEIAFNL